MPGLSLTASRIGPPPLPPVTFRVDDELYELPELDTRTWLETLILKPPGCWLGIIPGRLAGDGPETLTNRMFHPDDPFDLDDCEHVAEQVLSQACGIDLYPACQLAKIGYANWLAFDGWCVAAGFDPLAAPIPRTLAAVWSWRVAGCADKTDLARLDNEVWVMPPPTTASGRPREAGPLSWSDEAEAAAFEAVIASLGKRSDR